MARVRAPVLTIHGTWDRNAPYAGGREWALTLPDARLITVEKVSRTKRDPDSRIEHEVDLGFVGDPKRVDPKLIEAQTALGRSADRCRIHVRPVGIDPPGRACLGPGPDLLDRGSCVVGRSCPFDRDGVGVHR